MKCSLINYAIAFISSKSHAEIVKLPAFADLMEKINEAIPEYFLKISNEIHGVESGEGDNIIVFDLKILSDNDLSSDIYLDGVIEKIKSECNAAFNDFFKSNSIIYKQLITY